MTGAILEDGRVSRADTGTSVYPPYGRSPLPGACTGVRWGW